MSKRTYDCIRRPFNPTAPRYVMPETVMGFPPKADLRPLCPPIYDQGSLGCCTGNGWAFIVNWLLIILYKTVWMPSRLFIYYYERVMEGSVKEDSGAAVADGARVLTTKGICSESYWPYIIAKFTTRPSLMAIATAFFHKVTGVAHIDNSKIDEIKSALVSGSPIVIGFSVFESFESEEVAKTGLVPMPKPGEAELGGHCTCLVGYDDTFAFPPAWAIPTGGFVVRNSWGAKWGLAGYFMVPYAYFTDPVLASDFWIAKKVA